MEHRHLTGHAFSLAAIDDVIARGRWRDWMELRRAVLRDRVVCEKVAEVCAARLSDPYAQRHYFWNQYVKRHAGR